MKFFLSLLLLGVFSISSSLEAPIENENVEFIINGDASDLPENILGIDVNTLENGAQVLSEKLYPTEELQSDIADVIQLPEAAVELPDVIELPESPIVLPADDLETIVALPALLPEAPVALPAEVQEDIVVALPAEVSEDLAVALPAELPEAPIALPAELPEDIVVALPAEVSEDLAVALPAELPEAPIALPAELPEDVVVVLPVEIPETPAVLPVDVPETPSVLPADEPAIAEEESNVVYKDDLVSVEINGEAGSWYSSWVSMVVNWWSGPEQQTMKVM